MINSDSRTKQRYDLAERTTKFGEEVLRLCRKLPQNAMTNRLIDQLVGSATSIGANYAEANGASSKKDFRNKIHITLKECNETQHTIRLLAAALPEHKPRLRELWKECHELTRIFQAVTNTLNRRKTSKHMTIEH